MQLPPFVPGLELSRRLYEDAVAPLLRRDYPQLPYCAALIGPGSEVLGYDSAQSMDHDWGPKLQLFLDDEDLAQHGACIDALLRSELPATVAGFPTDLAVIRADAGKARTDRPGRDHSVALTTLSAFCRDYAQLDLRRALSAAQWLTMPSEILLTLTAGAVFYDGLGGLEALRQVLVWYPHDIWLYLLSAQWGRIGQEEAFPGRCAQVGDEIGSRLVAGRLVNDLMRLCFLMERRYAPYIKWFGTAFKALDCADEMGSLLDGVLTASAWPQRHEALCRTVECAARLHNRLGLTAPLPEAVSPFCTRPFDVIHAERFSNALYAAVGDAEVLALPRALGGVDQYLDSTDALNMARQFERMYG